MNLGSSRAVPASSGGSASVGPITRQHQVPATNPNTFAQIPTGYRRDAQASSLALVKKYADSVSVALRKLRREAKNFFNEVYMEDRVKTDLRRLTYFNRTTNFIIREIYRELEHLVNSGNLKSSMSESSKIMAKVYDVTLSSSGLDVYEEEDIIALLGNRSASQVFVLSYVDRMSRMDRYRKDRYYAAPQNSLGTIEEDSVKLLAMLETLKDHFAKRSNNGTGLRNVRITSIVPVDVREIVVEIKMGTPQDVQFVPQMKLFLVFLNSELALIRIGAPKEKLWSKDSDSESEYEVFRKISRVVAQIVLAKHNLKKIPSQSLFISIVSFIQRFTKCFYSKCAVCRKTMRDFLPPIIIKQYGLDTVFIHEDCELDSSGYDVQ
uniref:Mediator of RNA polymerase II transcription subunit 27 n=1 Tax=Haemonchus contortus TaxID=6289 RepID=A0A7I4YTJ3_HAECO